MMLWKLPFISQETPHTTTKDQGCSRFGSVRFKLKKPTEPNYSIVAKNEPNRTENRFKPNRSGSVKSGFLRKKPGNLIPWVFLELAYGLGRFSLSFITKYPKRQEFTLKQHGFTRKAKKKPWGVTRCNPQMLQLTLKISSIINNMKQKQIHLAKFNGFPFLYY